MNRFSANQYGTMSAIAALYPNSDSTPSGKTRRFNYEEMLTIVEFSGAPHSIRQGTLSALKARGRWPNDDGPATGVVCVSLIGMMLHGVCCRSTARWRARRAVKLGYWRQLRDANSWSNCPKCGAERNAGKCEKCDYHGRAKTPEGKANFDEFCRPFMYEIDIEKFRSAPRPREIRHFEARTYSEYKEAAKRGQPSNITPIRKPAQAAQPADPPREPVPAAPVPQRQVPATEHHRSNERRPREEGVGISERVDRAAARLMELCGLPQIDRAVPYVVAAVIAEARFSGTEVEDAAKYLADCVIRDQKNGVTISRFYFRDAQWRSRGALKGNSASSERSERSKRNILDGFAANAGHPDAPDGS